MDFQTDSGEAIDSFGTRKTPEERAAETAARADADAFREQRKREMAAEKSVSDKEARERAEELLEQNAVEVCMVANPNFSLLEAKRLYNHSLRQIIAIRRFEMMFFAEKPKADFHM